MTAAIGGIRWLLHVYLKQSEKIEELRSRHEREHLNAMKKSIKDLTLEIDSHKRQLSDLSARIVSASGRIQTATDKIDQTALDLSRTLDRFSKIETSVINLTKDMILIKGHKQ